MDSRYSGHAFEVPTVSAIKELVYGVHSQQRHS